MIPERLLIAGLRALTIAGILVLAACEPGDRAVPVPTGPFVVRLALVDSTGTPAPGVAVLLRGRNDPGVAAITDSAGRATVELTGSGAAMLVIGAGDGPRLDDRSGLPLLLSGDTVDVHVATMGGEIHVRPRAGDSPSPPALRWSQAIRLATGIQERQYDLGKAGALGPGHAPDREIRALADSAWTAMAKESHAEVRGALAYAVLMPAMSGPIDPGRAELALQAIDPTAAVWDWAPGLVLPLVQTASAVAERATGDLAAADPQSWAGRRQLARQRARTYVDRVMAEHPHADVRKAVTFAAMRQADQTGRLTEALEYRQQLLERFPASAEARRAEADPPGREVGPGQPVPAVVLPSLDTTRDPIDPADLAGPATLVDFWATWCTPCVGELPVLRAAHRRFHDHGFRIVSVSYDTDREVVQRFIAGQPMPWQHAFVGLAELSTGDVASAYGIDALPHAVLIGADGRILALQDDLRGAALARTLERVLGDATGAGDPTGDEPAPDSPRPWWLGGGRDPDPG